MKNLFLLLLMLLMPLMLSGCFNDLQSPGTLPSTSKYITAADFSGADQAQNLTTGIKITWSAVVGKNVIGYRIYKYSGSIALLIASVSPDTTYYIDGDVISGSKYQYTVKAVDPSNTEDDNTKRVSTLAWSGLTSVISNDLDKITVNFENRLQGVLIRLYLQRTGGVSKTVIKDLATQTELEAGTYVITREPDSSKLKPGAEYTIYAEIYEQNRNVPDGNDKAYKVNTRSYGYDGIVGEGPGWRNAATVRAFGRAKDIQDDSTNTTTTTGNTVINPKKAQVEIGFLPFNLPQSLSASDYRYVVFRFGENEQIDTSTVTKVCDTPFDATTNEQPCIVPMARTPTVRTDINPTTDLDNGLFRIKDTDVWHGTGVATTARPPRYRYTMALRQLTVSGAVTTVYTEKMPIADVKKYSVLVPIPPDYMVLVNREAANYEYCTIQRSASVDATNHNRCANAEVGSRPYNSGPGNAALNLDLGYYDFGYNLFVDRYPLACNTPNSAQSVAENGFTNITANANYGNNVSAATGATAAGSVLFSTNGTEYSNCTYRASANGSWLAPNQFESLGLLAADAAFTTALTNKPDANSLKFKFSYPNWSSELSQQACERFSADGYGSKRIARLREYRAFTAPSFSKVVVDSNVRDFYYSETSAGAVMNSTWNEGQCVYQTATGIPAGDVAASLTDPSINTNYIGYTNSGNSGPRGFALGASATAHCISKYGVSDVLETSSNGAGVFSSYVSTAWYATSDYFFRNNNVTPVVFKGLISPLDSGNIDVSFDITGEQTGYTIEIGGTTNYTTSISNYDHALGLPTVSSQQGITAYTPIAASSNYGSTSLARFPTGSSAAYYARATSRYTLSFSDANTVNTRVRCVVPAD